MSGVRNYFQEYYGNPARPCSSNDGGRVSTIQSISTSNHPSAMPNHQLRQNYTGSQERSDRTPDPSNCKVRKYRNQVNQRRTRNTNEPGHRQTDGQARRYGQYRRKDRKSVGSGGVRLVTLNFLWNEPEMMTAQETDPDHSLIMKAKQRNAPKPKWEEVSPLSKAAKCYWAQWDRLELRNGMLHCRWESADRRIERWQLVVPEKYKEAVLKRAP